MYDEILLNVDGTTATVVQPSTLPDLNLLERQHLQEWIVAHPQLLGDGVRVVTTEFDRWQAASGELVSDRLDILGLDPDGRLVVAELKRDLAPGTIHMQAINYAAMVSRLKIQDIAELWATTHASDGKPLDVESTIDDLQSTWLVTEESIKAPRIVLVASGFPSTVTASVVWLNERGVDVTLITFRPYKLADGSTVVSFTRTYPVPKVEEFTIGRRQVAVADSGHSPEVPWDRASLERLAEQANVATLALLDLCASEEADGVSVQDIMDVAHITVGQVRGQLAGFTMRLRNPKYGFLQDHWPVTVNWLPGGWASYEMDPALAREWRLVRSVQPSGVASPKDAG